LLQQDQYSSTLTQNRGGHASTRSIPPPSRVTEPRSGILLKINTPPPSPVTEQKLRRDHCFNKINLSRITETEEGILLQQDQYSSTTRHRTSE
jgi:hypothetical protein